MLGLIGKRMRETQGLLSRTYHLKTGYGSEETGHDEEGPFRVCGMKHWWGAFQAGAGTLLPQGAFVVSFLLLGPVPL